MPAWTFATAVAVHWVSVLGGPLVAIVLFVWQEFGHGPDVPRWVFWALVGGSVLMGAFRAWNDERLRADGLAADLLEIRDGRPDATLRVLADGAYVVIEVRNEGATGTFTATVETDGGGGGALQPMPVIWDLTNSHEPYEIPHGAYGRLRIAAVDEERRFFVTPEAEELGPDYGWQIFFHRLPGLRGWFAGRRDVNAPDQPWFVVRVVVRSQPQLEEGLVSKRLRLVGRHAIDLDSGERHMPRPIVKDDYEDYYR